MLSLCCPFQINAPPPPPPPHLISSIPLTHRAVTTMFLFLIRGLATGAFQAAYAYTPEVYPTNVRAIGMGVNVAAARLGAIVTPYVAQVRDMITTACAHMHMQPPAYTHTHTHTPHLHTHTHTPAYCSK